LDYFEKLLLQHRDARFLVVDPPGGKGDRLIFMGLEKKLKELNIKYRTLRYGKKSFFLRACTRLGRMLSKSKLKVVEVNLMYIARLIDEKAGALKGIPEDIILFRGGAYLNDIWKEYSILDDIYRAIQHKAKVIVVIAPQSFFFRQHHIPNIFTNIKQELHIFCRERTSYDMLCSARFPKNVYVHLSHDTALYLTEKDFSFQDRTSSYVLIAPRRDIESAVTWRIEKLPRKVKILFGDITLVPDLASFVNIIANASKVYTDRLHVAILSAILGKETYLYPNCYHKNKGVYEFSLRRFPNVSFIDSYEFPTQTSRPI